MALKPTLSPSATTDSSGSDEQAIIDIGSNTVRLVIYGAPPRAPTVLYNEKVTARLGKGVAEDGRLSEKSMASVLTALGRFEALLRLRGVKTVQTAATAAARDAANGPQFMARVAALGLSPRLLSGEEEALTSARGVIAAFPGAVGVVADLGGGSLELTDIAGDSCTHGTSLPLGTLRLPGLRVGGPLKFARRVQKMLGDTDWSTAHGQPLYLVGGSLRALARYAMLRQGWPVDDPHGFEMAPEEALHIARALSAGQLALADAAGKVAAGKIAAAKLAGPKGMPGKAVALKADVASLVPAIRALADLDGMRISASRLASLPDAAALLGVLVRELKPSRLVFSSWGLREGLLAGTFSPSLRARNPMLDGIASFADTQSPGSAAAAGAVVSWTARVCAVAGPGDSGSRPANDSLRLSATMLALASVRIEPNLRTEIAAKWALRKRWIGINAEGRAMLAMAVLANSSRIVVPAELVRLASPARLREATAWGLATRLCRRFTGAGPQAIADSALTVERRTGGGGRLVLSVRASLAALYSEVVEKDLRLLADCLGLVGEFRCLPAGAPLP
jgi:exopolyphosphatase/guanosine-5'-triphosphate,3'-diphosphate pyrophosphatase